MQRDPRAFLWEVRESALVIQSFTNGMDAAAYANNAMAQAAVERKFEVIGEALNQLSKCDAAPRALSCARKRSLPPPHRNAILGRASTPDELAFLSEPGSSF